MRSLASRRMRREAYPVLQRRPARNMEALAVPRYGYPLVSMYVDGFLIDPLWYPRTASRRESDGDLSNEVLPLLMHVSYVQPVVSSWE